MAENKEEQLTDEELAQLQLAEENENAVDRLVKELGCPTRRIRQFAARVLQMCIRDRAISGMPHAVCDAYQEAARFDLDYNGELGHSSRRGHILSLIHI